MNKLRKKIGFFKKHNFSASFEITNYFLYIYSNDKIFSKKMKILINSRCFKL